MSDIKLTEEEMNQAEQSAIAKLVETTPVSVGEFAWNIKRLRLIQEATALAQRKKIAEWLEEHMSLDQDNGEWYELVSPQLDSLLRGLRE